MKSYTVTPRAISTEFAFFSLFHPITIPHPAQRCDRSFFYLSLLLIGFDTAKHHSPAVPTYPLVRDAAVMRDFGSKELATRAFRKHQAAQSVVLRSSAPPSPPSPPPEHLLPNIFRWERTAPARVFLLSNLDDGGGRERAQRLRLYSARAW